MHYNTVKIPSGKHISHPLSSPSNYLIQLYFIIIRQRDYEGYLCVPFFPADKRNTQYAIRAFNVELASIRENVSKPEIGKMRMQFWKDTVDQIYAVS